jgi:hypothetical protein
LSEIYEHPGTVETEFTDEELEAMLGIVEGMTKGLYTVPHVKPGHAPHLIKVAINIDDPAPRKHEGQVYYGWMCLAAVLQWGPDIVDDHLHVEDHSLKTKTKQRLSNAATIAWVGNNLHRLLYEVVEMRKCLKKLDLIEPRNT